MHWSRLPDFMLAGVTLALTPFFGLHSSSLISIGVVPLIYLLIFALAVFVFIDRYLGEKYRFIGMIFVLGSHAVAKFYPGAIDHHNLQLIIVALFLALTPLTNKQTTEVSRYLWQSILVALSLWIGLDNFIFFVLYLAGYTFYCVYINNQWINYFYKLCLSIGVFSSIIALLNRPLSEFLLDRYDAVSIPFVISFFSGALFLITYKNLAKNNQEILKNTAIAITVASVCFAPVLVLYPELVKGAYSNYPALVKEFWLGRVNEAQSMYLLITKNGIISSDNYILFFIPALSYPLLKNKKTHLNIIYIILISHLALAFLWQVRAINLCFILSAPLQILVLYKLSDKLSNSIASVILFISGTPITILICISLFEQQSNNINQEPEIKNKNEELTLILNKHDIHHKKILSGVETGSKILAKTNNSIVSAPYHRNINGNSFTISIFLEHDMQVIRDRLNSYHIDYIVINNDHQLSHISNSASDESLINLLSNHENPEWLKLVNEKSSSNYQLFKFEG